MSRDIFLNPQENDLQITNGQINLTETQEEFTRQSTSIYLSGFRGEYFADINAFLPWLANDNNPIQLLGKTDKRLIDTFIKQGILGREGIVRIDSYSSFVDKPTRKMTVSFTATTESGSPIVVENIELEV